MPQVLLGVEQNQGTPVVNTICKVIIYCWCLAADAEKSRNKGQNRCMLEKIQRVSMITVWTYTDIFSQIPVRIRSMVTPQPVTILKWAHQMHHIPCVLGPISNRQCSKGKIQVGYLLSMGMKWTKNSRPWASSDHGYCSGCQTQAAGKDNRWECSYGPPHTTKCMWIIFICRQEKSSCR